MLLITGVKDTFNTELCYVIQITYPHLWNWRPWVLCLYKLLKITFLFKVAQVRDVTSWWSNCEFQWSIVMYLYRFREPLKRHVSVPEGEAWKKNPLMKNKQESLTRKVIVVPQSHEATDWNIQSQWSVTSLLLVGQKGLRDSKGKGYSTLFGCIKELVVKFLLLNMFYRLVARLGKIRLGLGMNGLFPVN